MRPPDHALLQPPGALATPNPSQYKPYEGYHGAIRDNGRNGPRSPTRSRVRWRSIGLRRNGIKLLLLPAKPAMGSAAGPLGLHGFASKRRQADDVPGTIDHQPILVVRGTAAVSAGHFKPKTTTPITNPSTIDVHQYTRPARCKSQSSKLCAHSQTRKHSISTIILQPDPKKHKN